MNHQIEARCVKIMKEIILTGIFSTNKLILLADGVTHEMNPSQKLNAETETNQVQKNTISVNRDLSTTITF